jgi:hypothetical protein
LAPASLGPPERVEHFFRELVRFISRTRPNIEAIAEVVARTKAVRCKVQVDPRELTKWVGAAERTAAATAMPGEEPGLSGRFWRGDRDELGKLSRSKKPHHAQVFDFSTRDGGQLYWELGPGHAPEGFVTPPYVGRLDGVLALSPGLYRMHLKCDDGVHVDLNGSTLFDTWEQVNEEGAGKHWHRWLSRDVWLDGRSPISIDTWDGGNAYNLTLRIEARRPDGSWKRVPFELFH